MNIQGVKQRFGIIGRSPLLERALNTAMRVATTDLSVLIQGESGVGKEIFSRIIHELSLRKHNNFIAINCGAIPPGTINSELFGHEKGSFTGAVTERKGYFETVNGGTIFLDEIGEMPLDTQAYLLRILESGEFLRVGSSKVLNTDVRVVAATNVNLEEKIHAGKFREDLYYRLNTVPIRVPALHERREDIYMLFRKFSGDFAEKYRSDSITLTPEAKLILENYRWPGNIRELKNMVEQLSVLVDQKEIDAETLVELAPQIKNRLLPSKGSDFAINNESGYQEREILFKFLLEMKSDLSDVKSLIFELVRANDLTLPDISALKNMQGFGNDAGHRKIFDRRNEDDQDDKYGSYDSNRPIILSGKSGSGYNETEDVEEILSIEEMEKGMIRKALKKFNNRRKDAADELGISERTLYRKIKEYNIPD
ncbi:MAG TPA: sigma-54 dependent transcriptional regulator [Saprospiraceae bacterium]|nr:sigma-54-dependent Fis family transcriptional regulator [Saprospiraceae bacterium]MBK7697506.1 sigma-54-dependent Fis family transcriptional regulator [Saprospiraceae bacterium]MBK8885929.1 sigma-54-dependent Fis family transcriptional regulator [Saprospiraceae bacterium]MBK9582609.1 sigma-54-dependent Fis family transcriptional regulator [Saprospiraceae bacterium]HMT51618.1 sigma-54 dependent transcriptional regulator [Saprospiraceae bacterium]